MSSAALYAGIPNLQAAPALPAGKILPCQESLALAPTRPLTLRRGIGWLKFRSVKDVAPALAYLTLPHLVNIASISQLQKSALLVPIPLHYRRQRVRGFNQAEEITRAIHMYTNIPFSNLLARPRATHAQARLPHELRQQNISGAFSITHQVPHKARHLILVDDVTTSGSTLSAAAQALLPTEAQIWGLTVAGG
ncbi:MAG: hypothetical protein WD200_05270 [Candidatus Andersenbacteria bacterium]